MKIEIIITNYKIMNICCSTTYNNNANYCLYCGKPLLKNLNELLDFKINSSVYRSFKAIITNKDTGNEKIVYTDDITIRSILEAYIKVIKENEEYFDIMDADTEQITIFEIFCKKLELIKNHTLYFDESLLSLDQCRIKYETEDYLYGLDELFDEEYNVGGIIINVLSDESKEILDRNKKLKCAHSFARKNDITILEELTYLLNLAR